MMRIPGLNMLLLFVCSCICCFKGSAQKRETLAFGFFREYPSGDDSVKDPVTHKVLYYHRGEAICNLHDIVEATAGTGEYSRAPVVRVRFSEKGKRALAKATRDMIGQRMLVIAGDSLLFAPRINQEISGGALEISSSFSIDEARKLAVALTPQAASAKSANVVYTDIQEAIPALDEALVAGDETLLSMLLHDDVSFGHSNGWVQNKIEVIHDRKKNILRYTDIKQLDLKDGKHWHDMMGIRRKLAIKGVYKDEPFDMVLWVWEVWIKEKGSWKLWVRQGLKAD